MFAVLIHNKVGPIATAQSVAGMQDMNSYIYEIADRSKDGIHQEDSTSAPPNWFLNVRVLEARDLEAKDVNGFSDPYCILGIVPGHDLLKYGGNSTNSNIVGHEEKRSASRSNSGNGSNQLLSGARNSLRRLSRSFRPGKLETKDVVAAPTEPPSRGSKRLILKDVQIPAKFMRSTSVKENTLNPVWSESFQFELDDLRNDKLHLDIWDHDEETSVLDAVRSLNEVRGVKQLGSYFKQVGQSARKGGSGDLDDFLGCITVDLNDLPTEGHDQWYILEGRSSKSKVQGSIRLQLELTVLEEGVEQTRIEEIREHIRMTYALLTHELKLTKRPSTVWSGQLSPNAEFLLRQHALQNGLYKVHVAMSRWICYAKIYRRKPIACSIVQSELQQLLDIWADKSLKKEHKRATTNYKVFKKLDADKDDDALTERITDPEVRFYVRHLHQLNQDLELTKDIYAPIFAEEMDIDLLDIVYSVYADQLHKDVYATRCLHELANKKRREVVSESGNSPELSYTNNTLCELFILYQILLEFQHHHMAHNIEREDTESNSIDWYSWFEPALFTLVQRFTQIIQAAVEKDLRKNQDFHANVTELPRQNNRLSQESDSTIAGTLGRVKSKNSIRESRSSVCTAEALRSTLEVWTALHWPDPNSHGKYSGILLQEWKMKKDITLFIEDTNSSCNYAAAYARQLHEKLRLRGFCDEQGQFDISNQLCFALNNLAEVLQCIQDVPDLLRWRDNENVVQRVPTATPLSSTVTAELRQIRKDCLKEIHIVIDRILSRVTAKMRPEIRKNVFHLCWCSASTPIEKALNDLIVYLESNFETISQLSSTDMWERCTLALWTECLKQLIEQTHKEAQVGLSTSGPGAYLSAPSIVEDAGQLASVIPLATHFSDAQLNASNVNAENSARTNNRITDTTSNIGSSGSADEVNLGEVLKAKAILLRLDESLTRLAQFFLRIGHGQLRQEVLQNEMYENISYLIRMYNSSSPELVELYFIEMMHIQDTTVKTEFGSLKVNLYMQHEKLFIEVLSAHDLVSLDSNGLSDPFVIVELLPRHIFSSNPKPVRTRVVKNNLQPVFNEEFEFSVTIRELEHPAACVAFVIMDHDMLLSDDLEGVTFLRLSGLFDAKRNSSGRSKAQTTMPQSIPVLHPLRTKYSALHILGQRTDVYSQEVYKRWSSISETSCSD